MSADVISFNGGPTSERTPVQDCIGALEEWLDMARAGEIIGVSMTALAFDGTAMQSMGGCVGGYSMLGAANVAVAELTQMIADEQ